MFARALPEVKAATIGTGEFSFAASRSTFLIDGKQADDSQFLIGSMVSALAMPRPWASKCGPAVEISEQEIAHGEHVGMINETLARLWPAGQNPIGRRVRIDALSKESRGSPRSPGPLDPYITVVGVLADTRNAGLREPTRPAVYVPYTLRGSVGTAVVVPAQGDPLF